MSTVNLVKYYFYKGMMPKDPELLKNMVSLAYQTARDRKLYPKAILIRSGSHNTTTINGTHQEDPNGWHLTFCYKDSTQLANGCHTACHGYTPGKDVWELVKSTHAGVKSDSVLKRNGKPVWPAENELEVAPEIGYGHL
ncbi:hypothetical protein KXV70_001074 [Aspergillus fumigatus]|uniref:Uncharacterized protein n=2 Tax=Aspergillus fumigatus TaxID=746128 RepID=B0Y521_ASPFC|nr:hypothetical protein AFUB_071110 [Aspergillus fumigatus A1163]KAH1396255.1 hypothetical protein KXX49_008122 [Aspergillus fumigatus]KAH1414967.1 hypothetical protein KXX64_007076 [Aspergillus fumigatus]KAH1567487.1 hypothetical protein KXX17_002206 [Aspergillus fumigatus]KAH1893699.1 hypothetical protein KXV57_002758 [Aspergillus fumigatus]